MSQKRRIQLGEYEVDVCLYISANNRPAIVMVHGIGVSGRYFLPLASKLAEAYDIHIIDLPGYGETPRPHHALSISELADVIVLFIRHQKLESPALIGQSMGCQIVAHVVREYPSCCSRVILLGPTVDRRERSLLVQGLRLLQDMLKEPPSLNCMIFSDYLKMGVVRYLQTARMMINDCIEETLVNCTIPVCIIRGEKDKIASRAWLAVIASAVSRTTLREIPGAPHVAQFVQPAQVAKICRQFLGH